MSRSGEGDDNPMPEDLTETRTPPAEGAAEAPTDGDASHPVEPHLEVKPRDSEAEAGPRTHIFEAAEVEVAYGGKPAVTEVSIGLAEHEITALIGPSGCGKSTFLRCLNRMNDLIPSASVTGSIVYHGQDLYAKDIDPVSVRKRIGMVFQKPNPFPK